MATFFFLLFPNVGLKAKPCDGIAVVDFSAFKYHAFPILCMVFRQSTMNTSLSCLGFARAAVRLVSDPVMPIEKRGSNWTRSWRWTGWKSRNKKCGAQPTKLKITVGPISELNTLSILFGNFNPIFSLFFALSNEFRQIWISYGYGWYLISSLPNMSGVWLHNAVAAIWPKAMSSYLGLDREWSRLRSGENLSRREFFLSKPFFVLLSANSHSVLCDRYS